MMAIGQHPSPLDASGPNLDLRCNFWAGRPKAIKPGRKHYRAGSGRRCRRRKDVKNEGSSGDMYENTRLMNRTSIDETRLVNQIGASFNPAMGGFGAVRKQSSRKTAELQDRSAVRTLGRKKNSFLYVRGRNVYENKGPQYTMPE